MADKLKPAYVRWIDTTAHSGWHNDYAIAEVIEEGLIVIETLGWLLDKNDDFIVLAMSTSRFKAADIKMIPIAAILDLQYMESDDG